MFCNKWHNLNENCLRKINVKNLKVLKFATFTAALNFEEAVRVDPDVI